MKTLHEAYTTGIVMQRYYAITHPDRKYSQGQALRQSKQDKNIDKKVLKQVLKEILKEAIKML